MHGFASKAKDWTDLIRNTAPLFNEYLWIFNAQTYWNFAFPIDEIERAMSNAIADCACLPECSALVIKQHRFTKIARYLGLDEWTYLSGFPLQGESADELLAKWAKDVKASLTKEHFDFLLKHNGILIMWVDGWFEVFPSNHRLAQRIARPSKDALTESQKWINFRSNPALNVHPNFLH